MPELPSGSPRPRSIHALAAAALFVALSVILTRLLSVIVIGGAFRPELGHVPIQLAGLLLGPLYGALVGLAADLAGVLVLAQGSFHPGFTLSSVLVGLLPGLVVRALRGSSVMNHRLRLPLLVLLATLSDWLVAQLLTTLWLTQLLGASWTSLFVLRLLPVTLRSLLNGAVLAVLLRVLRQVPIRTVSDGSRVLRTLD